MVWGGHGAVRTILFAAERRGRWDVGRNTRNRRGRETAASAVYTSRWCDRVSVSVFRGGARQRVGVKRVFRYRVFYYSGSARNAETFLTFRGKHRLNHRVRARVGFRSWSTVFSKQTPNESGETFASTSQRVVVVGRLAPNDGEFLIKNTTGCRAICARYKHIRTAFAN